MCRELVDCLLEFGWVKSMRAPSTGIGHTVVLVEEIESFRPGYVRCHNGVVHFVHIGADAVLHGGFTFSSEFSAFFDGLRIWNTVIAHMPSVYGMCFPDVDDQKFYVVMVRFVKVAETHRLPDKRWSGEATEDEGDRFLFVEVRKAHRV